MKKEENQRTVCIIPARYGSTRLPGKPLVVVKGLPLVMWVYNRALESDVFDEVVVATDDARIMEAVTKHRGRSVMTSEDHVSGTDRIREAVQTISCTHIINLQGDEPLVPVEIVREFAESCKKINDSTLLTCVSNATIEDKENPNVVKAVLGESGKALYFSRAPIPFVQNGQHSTPYRHTGIYGFTRAGLEKFCDHPPGTLEQTEKLEQLRALEMGMTIQCLVREYDSTGIDTEEDLNAFRLSVEG